jgi:hypothetical protein
MVAALGARKRDPVQGSAPISPASQEPSSLDDGQHHSCVMPIIAKASSVALDDDSI